jgi:uncharacterized membrane protein YphA (DoxX/SURF4 family)
MGMMVIRWLLALALAVMAGLMMGDPGGAQTMFGALPAWDRWAIIAAELLLAAWLVSGILPRFCAFIAIVLLSVFLGAIVRELGKAEPRPCGCQGAVAILGHETSSVRKTLKMTLALDAALLLVAMAVYYSANGRRNVSTPRQLTAW